MQLSNAANNHNLAPITSFFLFLTFYFPCEFSFSLEVEETVLALQIKNETDSARAISFSRGLKLCRKC